MSIQCCHCKIINVLIIYGIRDNQRIENVLYSLRFFKGNYNEINRLLTNTDWNLELAQGDIDELWSRFNTVKVH
jgi:hypothetical protein